jgi:transposase
MNYNFFIGIDVSKKTLDFAVFKGKELLFKWVGENDEPGIKKFWVQLKLQQGFCINEAMFCMEHTGIYNQHLLSFLYSKKASVCVEAAVHIKLSSGLQRGKSDRIDAVRIAQYAYKNCMELRLWQPKRQVIQQLKHLSGLRNRVINARKQLTVALNETISFDKKAACECKKLCKASLKTLNDDIKRIELKMDQVIAADAELKRLFSIVTSVDGIGKVTARGMIITTNEFKDITDPAKFACYSGVAPFEYSSGSSIKGKPRVSHKANKNMKSLLHMAALVAINYNTDMKAYYQRKVEQKKNKMLVINAVRNKLIWRIFACVKNNRPYQKNYQLSLV